MPIANVVRNSRALAFGIAIYGLAGCGPGVDSYAKPLSKKSPPMVTKTEPASAVPGSERSEWVLVKEFSPAEIRHSATRRLEFDCPSTNSVACWARQGSPSPAFAINFFTKNDNKLLTRVNQQTVGNDTQGFVPLAVVGTIQISVTSQDPIVLDIYTPRIPNDPPAEDPPQAHVTESQIGEFKSPT